MGNVQLAQSERADLQVYIQNVANGWDEAVKVGGSFWTLDDPARKVRGVFSVEPGSDAEVELDDTLVDDPRVVRIRGGLGYTASAHASVKAFLPIVLHGQLDNGDAVTLLDARNHGGRLFSLPRYVATAALIGGHVDGEEQQYGAVRFRIGRPYWLGHLMEELSVQVDDQGSTLAAVDDAEGVWLVYRSASPVRLRELDIRVVNSCVVLAELVLHCEVSVSSVQLQVDAEGDWLQLLGDSFTATSHMVPSRTLLPREVLTVDLFARWIPLNDKLDGLSAAVAHKSQGPLQEEVLVSASLVEGLHRRLPYQQERFPGASKTVLRNVNRAARGGAGAQAEIEELDPESVMDAVVFLKEVSFRTRAKDITDEVCAVVPEIAEYVVDLPKFLSDIRNELAHHKLPNSERDPLEIRGLRWIVAAAVMQWLLRCLLLLKAGIPADVLHERVVGFNRFEMFRANTARLMDELSQRVSSRQ